MADEERRKGEKKGTKSKGKPKFRWKKPANLLNIGNKEKGHAFAEKRKKMALKEYKKLLRKTREQHENRQSADNRDNPPRLQRPTRVADVNTTGKNETESQGLRRPKSQQKRKQVNKFMAAESDFKKRKMEKEQMIKERETMIQKHREEVQEKMKKRRETFGRLNRRTRKGQPIMANQIEHLLDKIQSQT
ncbi:uncharacterized protein [Pocillopora verrucosa]|uniref:uncharacterized protein n=1 Tax=Pocillopora verrucosa TaxID=203993 RepID=UPI00333E6407